VQAELKRSPITAEDDTERDRANFLQSPKKSMETAAKELLTLFISILVINVCNHGEHYELPCVHEPTEVPELYSYLTTALENTEVLLKLSVSLFWKSLPQMCIHSVQYQDPHRGQTLLASRLQTGQDLETQGEGQAHPERNLC
jgi:hypothetical protein